MAKSLYFTKEHEMVRRAVREFVDKEINPHVDEWEEKGEAPLHDLFKKMGELGFLGLHQDPKYGGQGMDHWTECAFMEELARIDCGGVPMAIAVHTNMATYALATWGSDYLKETYLRPAIAGDMVSALAVTEACAGSDVAGIQSFARRDGDHYVLNGSKTYITNGAQADFLTLFARTSEAPGYGSFSLFIVPTNLPGFEVSKKLKKLGMHSSDTAELFFDNVKVPAQNLIGEEGAGFMMQMQQFQHERLAALPLAYVKVEEMIEKTVEYLRGRMAFGKPLIAKQVLRHRLVGWLTEAEALRQLTYHVVRMMEAGQDATREISMGKLLGGPLLARVSDGCLQMHGGLGFMDEMWTTRAYRDSRLLAIGGGANEVMCEIIAKLEGF